MWQKIKTAFQTSSLLRHLTAIVVSVALTQGLNHVQILSPDQRAQISQGVSQAIEDAQQ